MATTLKGPAIFLAQFAGDAAPFNSWDAICGWAASLGYKGVQVPSWDGRLFDIKKAAESKSYADEITGTARKHGVEITELARQPQPRARQPQVEDPPAFLRYARGAPLRSGDVGSALVQQAVIEPPGRKRQRQLGILLRRIDGKGVQQRAQRRLAAVEHQVHVVVGKRPTGVRPVAR